MKKIFALLIVGLLILSGCQEAPTSEVKDSIKYFGVAQLTNGSRSVEKTEDNPAKGQVEGTYVAVGLDQDKKVVSIDYDAVSVSLTFDENMQLPEGFETQEFKSKVVLRDDYNMKGASKIGKEWYEQIEALETWAKGKTVEEIKSKAGDADLKATTTVGLDNYVAVLEKAVANAVEVSGATKIGVGVTLSGAKSKNAGDTEPTVQFDVVVVGVATDDAGVVKASVIDGIVAPVKFDADGKFKITEMNFKSKQELKEDYKMKGASKIGKEWYEQTNGLAQTWVGKKLEDIKAQKAEDADLASVVTVGIDGFKTTAELAINSAK